MFRLMREPVALSSLHGLLGVLPGPPELHALLVALVGVKGTRFSVVVDAAEGALAEELVVRFDCPVLLGLWRSGDDARWLLRLAGGTHHL